jgi:hypothetical protein
MEAEPKKESSELQQDAVIVSHDPAPEVVRDPPILNGDKLPHGLTRKQIVLAFVIAGISDLISGFMPLPPVEWVVDLLTAGALFAVLGWKWLLLPGLIMEAIPGVAVIPFWVLVVSAIAVWGTVKPKMN